MKDSLLGRNFTILSIFSNKEALKDTALVKRLVVLPFHSSGVDVSHTFSS